jgi:hypothetical protein
VSDPENGKAQVFVRRRRTRRHRRNRIVRRMLVAVVLFTCCTGASTLALRYFGSSLFSKLHREYFDAEQQARAHDRELALEQVLAAAQPSRPVYQYSVIPGGVEDAQELKWVAEHDPVVAAHYAGFDYDHARVVRLTLARTAFVSYRIGNHIYWMRRRITLHKGEKLITDGRMTARGRCANRVEEKPQQEASLPQPPPESFDQPVQSGAGTAMQSPAVPFQSALLNQPEAAGVDPLGPLAGYSPFGGGSFFSTAPLTLPEGLCGPNKKGSGTRPGKKPGPCGSSGGGPSTIPEPSTWVMFASGLALVSWQARRKFFVHNL